MTDQKTPDASCASLLSVKLGVFCWKPDVGIWASGHVCYAGKWAIGSVSYVSGSKGDICHQGAFMKLPGLKDRLGVFATEDEARRRVEQAGLHWFKNLNTPNVEVQPPAASGGSAGTES